MDRFHPDGEHVETYVRGGIAVDRAVVAARRDNVVAAIEEFRNTGDRDLLADLLLAIVRNQP